MRLRQGGDVETVGHRVRLDKPIATLARARGRCAATGGGTAPAARRRTVEVETPHPRAAVKRIAERLERQAPRVGRRGRQEPAAPVRGRARAAEPSADDRTLAARAPWRSRASAGRGSCCAALEREGVLWNGPVLELADDARPSPPRAGRARRAARARCDRAQPALDATRRARSARRCSTSVSSPASGTCGRRRRCGRRASRRGRASASSPTTSFARS